jgi:D-glycero-beta-D-manno-heptose-7-phosphate kinase
LTGAPLETGDLARFPGRRILVVGDVILDRYIKGSVDRISPEAPVPVVRVRGEENRPGGAANVAANIASLGAVARLVAVVGADEGAALLRAELSSRGIDPGNLVVVPNRPTTVKTRVVAHQQQVVRLDAEDEAPVPAADADRVLERAFAELDGADAVVISDYAKGLLADDVLARLLPAAREKGLKTVIDPKRADFSRYQPATVLTPNLAEATRAARLEHASPARIAQAITAGLDVEAVLVTLGEAGMLLQPKAGEAIAIRAQAREVFDVTGAGDTVAAVLGVALAAGLDLEAAARWANAAAAVAVARFGTAAVSCEDLREVAAAFP